MKGRVQVQKRGFLFEGNDGYLILMDFLGDLEEECLPDIYFH